MPIVLGAPNILRGASQSGNLSALDVVKHGWDAVICADYHAPSLLPAAFRLVDEGLVDVPGAMRMLSRTPAQAVGLTDRGEIAPGYRADLVAVRRDLAGLPHVEATWSAGRPVFTFARMGEAALVPA